MTAKSGVSPKEDIEWPRADNAILRQHWGTMPPAKIGKMLSVLRSSNAVTKRASRLKLPMQKQPAALAAFRGGVPLVPKAEPPPPPPLTPEPIAWRTFTHWEPGDPSTWEIRTHETESYRRCAAVAIAYAG